MEIIKELSAFILALASVISIVSVMRYRVDKNDTKLDGLVKDVQQLVVEVQGFTREQAVINKFSADTMASIVKKVEDLNHVVSERASLVELVRELLRRVDHVNFEP